MYFRYHKRVRGTGKERTVWGKTDVVVSRKVFYLIFRTSHTKK